MANGHELQYGRKRTKVLPAPTACRTAAGYKDLPVGKEVLGQVLIGGVWDQAARPATPDAGGQNGLFSDGPIRSPGLMVG